jgi:dienelactone hydrolase
VRRLLIALTCTALLAFPVVTARAETWHTWTGTPTDVFRTGHYSEGEWVYTNTLRQALGANSDGLERTDYFAAVKPSPADPTSITYDLYNAFTYDFFGSHRAAHNGDYQLPTSLPAGTAEIAELRLAIEDDDLFVRVLWNAFPAADRQIATLTFDEGSVQPWPRDARQSGSWSTALSLWGSGAAVTRNGTDTAVAARSGDHVTEAHIPMSLLPEGPWTLRGGSGLAAAGRYVEVPPGSATATAPGSGGPLSPTNAWGLLFAGDSPWSFDELAQSRQLTTGVTTAKAQVDPDLLRDRRTALAPPRKGSFSRLLHSKQPSKDGITTDRSGALGTPAITPPIVAPDFNVSYFYGGALQDYAMHVPASYTGAAKTPLVIYLHGYTGLPEEAFRNPTGLVDAIAAKGWLLATALGRGDWFYRGGTPGEADVLEVLADVSKRYAVDPDRIYLMGHSMGGYGTNNLAAHHPDLFAAVAPAQGTDSQDLSGNLRNTPWFEMTSEEDLDFQGTEAKALYQRLSSAGYDATLLDYQLKTHEYSSIYDTIPRLLSFFDAHRRATRPAIVSWTRPVGQDNPKLKQRYDGAWWLRDVEPVSGVNRPTVVVESLAIPHAAPGPGTVTEAMVDEGGPTGRTQARLFRTVPPTAPAVLEPSTLKVKATGARSASVRLADAKLSGLPRLVLRSSVSHDLSLRLAGEGRRLHRTVDGVAAGTVTDGVVVLPRGDHTVVLTSAAAAPPRGDRLPATGGVPWAVVGLALLAASGVVGRARRAEGQTGRRR